MRNQIRKVGKGMIVLWIAVGVAVIGAIVAVYYEIDDKKL
jgi:hypothetical protein